MSQEEISKIKLSCIEQAKFICQSSPSEILKKAKEIFEWVIAFD
jgi:hypothetical protein